MRAQDSTHTQSSRGGFTLVELLVALGIFMIVMTVSTSIFTAIVRANRHAQAKHHALMSLGVAMESMMRTIEFGNSYVLTGTNQITVTDINGRQVRYRCVSCTGAGTGVLERQIAAGPWVRYTSDRVDINRFRFRVDHEEDVASGDEQQPLVTVAIEALVDVGAGTASTPFSIQLSASQITIDA